MPKGSQCTGIISYMHQLPLAFLIPPSVEFVDMYWPDPVLRTTSHLPVMQTGLPFWVKDNCLSLRPG